MKAALIGAGQIAKQHLSCLKTLPDVELVAICDLSPAIAEAAAERYSISAWFTDYRAMLDKARPDVVHITTPPTSHFGLALDSLDAGAHVIVEKPATRNFEELETLVGRARETGRHFVEDYNYVFNYAPQQILRRIESREFGAVTHVEVLICLDILGPDGFADPNSPHPTLTLAGGAIADFLPHLASLAYLFVGAHRTAETIWAKRNSSVLPFDEFRAVLDAERGTAALGFSSNAQPDAFWLRVYGGRMQATANLFETRLTFDGPRDVPKPLRPFFSGLEEGKTIRRAALATLLRKFKGPGAYEGPQGSPARTYGGAGRRVSAASHGEPSPRGQPDGRGPQTQGAAAMRALVTGANGFLGRHVVKSLLARGIDVRALVRPAARLEALGWPSSVEVFRADLRTSRELGRAFEGVDVLLHLAAVVSGGEDAQFAGTVVGTERLLEAMAASACRRLVLCSSFSVYDFSSARHVLDENSPLHKVPDVYARDGYTISKWWQERVTRRLAEEHGWDLIVLRPGFIWGRDHGYLAALGQQFGRHHLVIGPLTRMPMTHVENCADVFAMAAVDSHARGQTLNVIDGPGERIWTYLSDYMRGSGQAGWRAPVPYWLAIRAVRLAFATVFRRATKVPSILIPRRLESRLKPLRFENRRLRETLGWTPLLDYRQCLARTYGAAPSAAAAGEAPAPCQRPGSPGTQPGGRMLRSRKGSSS